MGFLFPILLKDLTKFNMVSADKSIRLTFSNQLMLLKIMSNILQWQFYRMIGFRLQLSLIKWQIENEMSGFSNEIIQLFLQLEETRPTLLRTV